MLKVKDQLKKLWPQETDYDHYLRKIIIHKIIIRKKII